jgi:hypothetical protein
MDRRHGVPFLQSALLPLFGILVLDRGAGGVAVPEKR